MSAMSSKKHCVLVVNPNTTNAMTDALIPLISSLRLDNIRFEYYTAPSGVPSINDEEDAAVSAGPCLTDITPRLLEFDAYLVCCYSQHPLVPRLRHALRQAEDAVNHRPVTGIFEASVATCLQSIDAVDKFGIVSTGAQWEEILDNAVAELLGSPSSPRYAGCATTGLNANELHTAPADDVARRMKVATKKLLSKGAKAVCLGCAGMAGMDRIVREACVEDLGEREGKRIKIVDGVLSGALFLASALRSSL